MRKPRGSNSLSSACMRLSLGIPRHSALMVVGSTYMPMLMQPLGITADEEVHRQRLCLYH